MAKPDAPTFALEGRIGRTTYVQLDTDDGSTIIAPEEMFLSPSFLPDVGTIVDIFCKITGMCGAPDKAPAKTCYKVTINADGTVVMTPVRCP